MTKAMVYKSWKLRCCDIFYGKKELVSVVVPTYNTKAEWLEKAILSIINQSYCNVEIIIIDDCGDIPFSGLKSKINDDRIKCVINSSNKGVSRTRNQGVEIAGGEWVSFLDADDWWERDKLEPQLNLAKNENVN